MEMGAMITFYIMASLIFIASAGVMTALCNISGRADDKAIEELIAKGVLNDADQWNGYNKLNNI
jgi:hypothetical protein